MTQHTHTYVISLGGSIVVPEQIDTEFVRRFAAFLMERVARGERFVVVVGGGRTARAYVEAATAIDPTVTDEDKDWIGIHATRLNAHLLRTVLRAVAHPRINDNPHDYEEFAHCKEPVIIASGWRPGFSTDFDAVVLGHHLGSQRIINLSNIDYIYDKDPRVHPDAQRRERMDWAAYRAMIGSQWRPGMHAPFDPVAARFADEHMMEVAFVASADLDNLAAYLDGGAWRGSVIVPRADATA